MYNNEQPFPGMIFCASGALCFVILDITQRDNYTHSANEEDEILKSYVTRSRHNHIHRNR